MTERDAEPIRVLLVEDDAGDAGLAQLALRGFRNARFSVAWAQTLSEAMRNIGAEIYDIVLLDLTLPDSAGIGTVERVLKVVGTTPIIVLTGQSDTEFGLSTLKAGAADYLVKGDFGYDGLARTIFYTLHRAKLEAELAEHRFHLEELVAKRTAELALAKEAAEAANRAKTAFLANMSHELRTPLNAILGFAQLMERDSGLDATHRIELQTISRSGRHLLALINDVLEIARIEAGRTAIHDKPFDLLDMLHLVEDMTRLRAAAKGLAFEVEHLGKLPFSVVGDAQRLRQVLINLLGNAVKYTDHGRVTLRLTPIDDHIRFEVADTGRGIAPEEQKRIFEAFYQTDAGAARGEGAGLGLTISHEFVRLMGGEISVESRLGQGCVFSFTLPLPATDDAPPTAMPHARVQGLQPGQAPVRVLVAEDAADSRSLIVSILGSVGFEVRAVENGAQAVDVFKTWQPHFIWMDIRMPVMDGYEAARQIRALPGGDQVKIVALTASVFEERLGDILEGGCDDVLSKPFEEENLFRVMSELLNVQYRYAETEAAQSAGGLLDLTAVSREQRLAVKRAAEELDLDAFSVIIAELQQNHPDVAEKLRHLVREFGFEQIQRAANVNHSAKDAACRS